MSSEEVNYSYVKVDNYYRKLKDIEKEAFDYNQLERLFELEKSGYKQLRDCAIDLKSLKVMWDAISMVNFQYNDWKGKPFR
jgi:dynein heavy chain